MSQNANLGCLLLYAGGYLLLWVAAFLYRPEAK
jgi:hypothetical protein